MTTFEFMKNAFFLFCGIACLALSVLAVYCLICAIAAILHTSRKKRAPEAKWRNVERIENRGRDNGGNQN